MSVVARSATSRAVRTGVAKNPPRAQPAPRASTLRAYQRAAPLPFHKREERQAQSCDVLFTSAQSCLGTSFARSKHPDARSLFSLSKKLAHNADMQTAPDKTATFETSIAKNSSPAAHRTALGTAAGALLSLDLDHILVKCDPDARVFLRGDKQAGYEIDVGMADFLLVRYMDVSALASAKANWSLSPAIRDQTMMDIIGPGGLAASAKEVENIGEMLALLSAAFDVIPTVALGMQDIIELPNPGTNTWFDDITMRDLQSPDGKGVAYAQFRSLYGSCLTPRSAAAAKAAIDQTPYLCEKVVGDIQGLAQAGQAQMVGRAFSRMVVEDRFDVFGHTSEALVHAYDHFSGANESVILARFASFFPMSAKVFMLGPSTPPTSMALLKRALLAGASHQGHTGTSVTTLMADDLERAMVTHGHLVLADKELAGGTMDARAVAVAKLAKGQEKSGGDGTALSSADESTTIKVSNSEGSWAAAASTPMVAKMLSDIEPLRTVPLDAPKVMEVLLSAETPAGLIYLAEGKRTSAVKALVDISQVLNAGVIQAAFNARLAVDQSKVHHPEWGTVVTPETCAKMLKGNWIKFTHMKEGCVVVAAGSLDLYADLAAPIVSKEDGVAQSLRLGPKWPDPLFIFLDCDCLRRSIPILKRWADLLGYTGSSPHSGRGLFQNILTRLEKVRALPNSTGKVACMQLLRWIVACALLEWQQNYKVMLETPVALARRDLVVYRPNGTTHQGMALLDTQLSRQKELEIERLFSPHGTQAPRDEETPDGHQNKWQKTEQEQKGFGALRHQIYPTAKGGYSFGGNFQVNPAEGKSFPRGCCAAKLCAASPKPKDWKKTMPWCSTPKECEAAWRATGTDPHAALPDGVAADDVVFTYSRQNDPASRWEGVADTSLAAAPGRGGRGGGAKGDGKGGGRGAGGRGGKGGGKGGKGQGGKGNGGKGGKGGGKGFGRQQKW